MADTRITVDTASRTGSVGIERTYGDGTVRELRYSGGIIEAYVDGEHVGGASFTGVIDALRND